MIKMKERRPQCHVDYRKRAVALDHRQKEGLLCSKVVQLYCLEHCLILYSSLDRPLITAVFSCLQIVPPTNKMKGAKIEIIGKSRQMLQFY